MSGKVEYWCQGEGLEAPQVLEGSKGACAEEGEGFHGQGGGGGQAGKVGEAGRKPCVDPQLQKSNNVKNLKMIVLIVQAVRG